MGVGDDIAPRFTQKPSLKQEDNGNKLVFSCALEASPKPEINWFRGTTPLTESDRIKMRVENAGGNTYNVLMDITGVTKGDGGSYKVVAKNNLGEMSASINLNFNGSNQNQQDGIAPNFTSKPVIKQEDGGKRLKFECQLTADPAPAITWFRDSTQLSDGGRLKMLMTPKGPKEYVLTLEISNVSPQDAGSYRVMAKNALGESNATIGLNFDGKEICLLNKFYSHIAGDIIQNQFYSHIAGDAGDIIQNKCYSHIAGDAGDIIQNKCYSHIAGDAGDIIQNKCYSHICW
ncbi:hypothetical protein ACF0H5_016306 [Mactra antiquata]